MATKKPDAISTVVIGDEQFVVEWLEREDFSNSLFEDKWLVEGNSQVKVEDGKLFIRRDENTDDASVATVWYREALPRDVLIRYRAKVIPPEEENAGNLNLFLHARELDGSPLEFGRSGKYSEYHEIPNYIFTFVGVTREGWSRARRDPGFNLIHHSDVRTELNEEYEITLVAKDGNLKYYIDGNIVHNIQDDEPLAGGHFGLRTFSTNAWWDDIEIGKLIPTS